MMQKKENEVGTLFPDFIMNDAELSWTEKAMLAYVYSFQMNGKTCFVSNLHLGEVLKISAGACKNMVAKLKKLNILVVENDAGNRFLKCLERNKYITERNKYITERNKYITEPSHIYYRGVINILRWRNKYITILYKNTIQDYYTSLIFFKKKIKNKKRKVNFEKRILRKGIEIPVLHPQVFEEKKDFTGAEILDDLERPKNRREIENLIKEYFRNDPTEWHTCRDLANWKENEDGIAGDEISRFIDHNFQKMDFMVNPLKKIVTSLSNWLINKKKFDKNKIEHNGASNNSKTKRNGHTYDDDGLASAVIAELDEVRRRISQSADDVAEIPAGR